MPEIEPSSSAKKNAPAIAAFVFLDVSFTRSAGGLGGAALGGDIPSRAITRTAGAILGLEGDAADAGFPPPGMATNTQPAGPAARPGLTVRVRALGPAGQE